MGANLTPLSKITISTQLNIRLTWNQSETWVCPLGFSRKNKVFVGLRSCDNVQTERSIKIHFKCKVPFFTLHIELCTLNHKRCTIHIALCTLHITLCTLDYAYCTMHTTLCKLKYEHCLCTLYFAHCIALDCIRKH